MSFNPPSLILTCEHAGNRVPTTYRHLFKESRPILQTHEAYDRGALPVARSLSKSLRAPLFYETVTRLVIDQNRSATNRNLFSRFSRSLSVKEKAVLMARVYEPYHHRIGQWIQNRLKGRGFVLHLAIHSFTPVLRGRVRNADIGLLYDPASPCERRFARALRQKVLQTLPDLRIRYNYPYRGAGDGLTTSFRVAFGSERYGGIEIEINQKWTDRSHLGKITRELGRAIKTVHSD